MKTKPKKQFNQKKVFHGFVDGEFSKYASSIGSVHHSFSYNRIVPSDAPCRITVEWMEK